MERKERVAQTTAKKERRKRRPPVVPWKKPKDMPRRPLSAYNLFFKEQRAALIKKRAEEEKQKAAEGKKDGSKDSATTTKKSSKRSNKSVGIGFANLARRIAADWRNLDTKSKAPFEKVAGKERKRYNEEMLVWRAKERKIKEDQAALRQEQIHFPSRSSDATSMHVDETTSSDAIMGSPHATNPGVAEYPPFRIHGAASLGLQHEEILRQREMAAMHHFGNSSLSQMEALSGSDYGRQDMLFGSNTFPNHYLQDLNSVVGSSAWNNSWPQQNRMLPAQASFPSPQELYQQPRRYTWSGSNDQPTRYSAHRRASNQHEPMPTISSHSHATAGSTTRSYPDSWLELDSPPPQLERRRSSSQPARNNSSTSSTGSLGSKIYPENWFHVTRESDAMGKVDSSTDVGRSDSPVKRQESIEKQKQVGTGGAATLTTPLKSARQKGQADEKAPHDQPLPMGQTTEEVTRGQAHTTSLQTLGMQLDDETVDFLTQLRFGSSEQKRRG